MKNKKIGRPTDNRKDFMLRVRMDDQTLMLLDEICSYYERSRSEVVRALIDRAAKDEILTTIDGNRAGTLFPEDL